MTTFKIAHINQQGVDLIIVPLDANFKLKQQREQEEAIEGLQYSANRAGLRGTVVLVWDNGGGRMAFIAPRPWHPFFESLTLRSVWANVNRELHV